MADKQITSSLGVSMDRGTNGVFGIYWATPLIGAIIFIDTTSDVVMSRTGDGGITWTNTTLENTTTRNISCWFDKETPGNTGNKIHVAHLNSSGNVCTYTNIDIVTETQASNVTLLTGLTVTTVGDANMISITVAKNDHIYIIGATAVDDFFYKSTNGGTAWNAKLSFLTAGATLNKAQLFPANSVDDADVAILDWDAGANALYAGFFDSSLNTWTDAQMITSVTEDSLHMNMDAAVIHSSGKIFVAIHGNDDVATDDLKTGLITVTGGAPTIVLKTNVFTDVGESAQVAVIIDQTSDDIYVAYFKGGTWRTTVDLFYKKSTDGGTTWGSEVQFNEGTIGDAVVVSGPRSLGTDGGLMGFCWVSYTNSNIATNFVNAKTIGVATYDQEGFRLRNDDGTEITATWKELQDVAGTLNPADIFGIRILTDSSSADPDTLTNTLQYRRSDEADTEYRTIIS